MTMTQWINDSLKVSLKVSFEKGTLSEIQRVSIVNCLSFIGDGDLSVSDNGYTFEIENKQGIDFGEVSTKVAKIVGEDVTFEMAA